MPGPDETFIVRVRPQEGDAVVEHPRRSRQRRVRDVSEIGPLITSWLGQPADPQEDAHEQAPVSARRGGRGPRGRRLR